MSGRRDGLLPKVSRPKEGANRGKTPAISSRQGSGLLKAPSGESLQAKRDRAILAVFLYHGLRVGEVASLKVGDLFEMEEVLHWRVRGKGDLIREVAAHPVAVGCVREYLKEAGHGAEGERALFRGLPNYIDDGSKNGGISTRQLYSIVKGYATKAGISTDAARPHAMRATAATNALKNGADIAEVQHWLGHSSIVTTKLYDKRVPSADKSPSFKVNY